MATYRDLLSLLTDSQAVTENEYLKACVAGRFSDVFFGARPYVVVGGFSTLGTPAMHSADEADFCNGTVPRLPEIIETLKSFSDSQLDAEMVLFADDMEFRGFRPAFDSCNVFAESKVPGIVC
jgi:hypothetical protein